MDPTHLEEKNGVVLGFGKAASLVMAGYFIIKIFGISADNNWHYLLTGWGAWFLFELLGFVLLPSILYAIGAREKKVNLIKWTSVLAVLGIVLNRLNVSVIAFNYNLPSSERYIPSWMEIIITVFLVTVGIQMFRFIVTKMPILYEHKNYKSTH
jgi:Ni/Fe-hydrogenase subunit HybB-like protein